MKLSNEEKSKVSSQFAIYYPGVPRVKCPICEGEKFTLEDEAFMLQLEGVLDRWIRFAVVHCDKCGHTHLFVLPPQQG